MNSTVPRNLAFDSLGDLWVVDAGYGRVLEFAYPLTSGEGASVVVGQSSFTTSVAALSQTGLASIWGVAFDSSGNLWVSDTSNNRVLEYSPPFSNGMPASLVLGAKDFTSTFSGLSAKSFLDHRGWHLIPRGTCGSRTRKTTESLSFQPLFPSVRVQPWSWGRAASPRAP